MSFVRNIQFIALTALSLCYIIPANGQQIPLYSQYFHNPFILNPSLTGQDDVTEVFLIHRSQWSNIPGKPVTTALTLDGPIKAKKIGLGLSLYSDKTDFTDRIGVYGTFSYRLNIGENSQVLFGLALGGLENRVDFTKAVVKDTDDPSLLTGYEKKATIDGNFGMSYVWKDLQFGVAVPQILGTSFKYARNNTRAYYDLYRHYLASLQYKIYVNSDKNISVTPLALVRFMPEAPIQYDINAIFNWKDIAWFAVSYRSNYAVGINARVRINKSINLGYTYDLITSAINTYSGTSHEIMLGYTFAGNKGADKELKEKYEAQIDSLLAQLDSTKQDELARQKEIDERYNAIIAEADSLFNAGRYLEAKAAYDKALGLKPNEQYPKDKIEEIDSMLNDNYLKAIAKADSLFKARDYKGALKAYQEALKYRPGDEYAKDRIAKITKIMDLFEKRYNTIIEEADSLFMAKQYKLAREKYKEALKFNPNARYPKDMISMIDSNKTGGDIRMISSSDFLDEFGNPAAKGFYVVMASFKNKDYADRLKKKNNYKSVFNKKREFHYVYMKRYDAYDEAKDRLINDARKTASDSWIYILR